MPLRWPPPSVPFEAMKERGGDRFCQPGQRPPPQLRHPLRRDRRVQRLPRSIRLFHGGPYSGLNGNDRHLERRLERVIEELKVLRPDVIGLQEVSVSRRRGSTRRVRLPIEGFHLTGGPCLGYPRAPLVSGRPTAPGRPRQPARGADHRRTGPEKDASPGYSRIIRASHGPEREMGNANMVARTQAGCDR